MKNKQKVALTKNEETLLIPLYAKAMESSRADSVFIDKKAEEILSEVDYDFGALKIPRKTAAMLVFRAKRLDYYTRMFLAEHPDGIVIHLGCGLDSRCTRIPHDKAEWYDLDLPEVIELRRRFYIETKTYHMIPSSVTDTKWIDAIQPGERPVFIVAEGLLMYLPEEDIKTLIRRFEKEYHPCGFAFDAYSRVTAKHAHSHPSVKKTGASVRWGINDPSLIEQWGEKIRLKEEWYFTQSEDIAKLGIGDKLIFSIAGMFKTANRAHRILYYTM